MELFWGVRVGLRDIKGLFRVGMFFNTGRGLLGVEMGVVGYFFVG